jgi:hypothetical protein
MPPVDVSTPFDVSELQAIARTIESYFRPQSFRVDRLAVALSSLWASFVTERAEQCYVSLTVVVESLLSTQEMEITHQLAERLAVLLATPTLRPIDIYRRAKRLYGTRSNIVHGRGMSKDDQRKVARLAKNGTASPVPDDFALHMHPMSTRVPLEDLQDLTALCIRLVRAFVLNDDLRMIVQTHDDQKLDEFFLDLLLGWVVLPDA